MFCVIDLDIKKYIFCKADMKVLMIYIKDISAPRLITLKWAVKSAKNAPLYCLTISCSLFRTDHGPKLV